MYPPYCFPYHYYHWRPVYPEVETSTFRRSAKDAGNLLADGHTILNRLSSSRDLAHKIMTAAQSSQKETVISLLRQTGVRSGLDASFNPDGITIMLINPNSRIFLILRWS
ncbi:MULTISPECIES: hypothetical protein [Bacillus]|uniref:hypothetical protein n=1 Tax=Bacillus TaxID=1386 RepID=UPI00040E7B7F|nr:MULTISPECIES: hypothetical protein [Bacillus]QHZ45772.1 hypothetical protein M654_005310 [Bacillus sp. NSP9.1]WFA04365.1 hypothetical protein P3X63_17420 [Bacillus sp. HSf4]